MLGHRCLCYIDDIIVIGRTIDEHLQNLEFIFRRLRENNLKVKISKCHFLQSSVKFLGHVISEKGLHTDPDKILAITKIAAQLM